MDIAGEVTPETNFRIATLVFLFRIFYRFTGALYKLIFVLHKDAMLHSSHNYVNYTHFVGLAVSYI